MQTHPGPERTAHVHPRPGAVVEATGVVRRYGEGETAVHALRGVVSTSPGAT